MGAVANAAMLIGSAQWRDLVTAATLYQAREVLSGAVDETPLGQRRRELARQTLASPGTTVQYMIPLIATLPEIATSATTVGAVNEGALLTAVAGMWNALAQELITLPAT